MYKIRITGYFSERLITAGTITCRAILYTQKSLTYKICGLL